MGFVDLLDSYLVAINQHCSVGYQTNEVSSDFLLEETMSCQHSEAVIAAVLPAPFWMLLHSNSRCERLITNYERPSSHYLTVD